MPAIAFICKYWKEIVIAGLCAYVWYVFADRDRLKVKVNDQATEIVKLEKDLESAEKMQQLTNRITEAIGQIKNRSIVNVTKIEQEQKPVFVGNNHPFVLVPGGLLSPVYSAYSARGTSPGNATGGSVGTVQPVR